MTESFWRLESRKAIQAAVEAASEGSSAAAVIKLIDRAYPFGGRSYWPYKCWLQERRISIAVLTGEWKKVPHDPTDAVADITAGLKPVPEVDAWVKRQLGFRP